MAGPILLGGIHAPGRLEVSSAGGQMEDRGETGIGDTSPDLPTASGPRQKWTLTQGAFDKLLSALGDDRESAGAKYIEIRTNLTRFFEWRGCPFPEDHADETLNRVAKRVAEGEELRNPSGYCIGVARLLLLEINKERAREQQAQNEIARLPSAAADSSDEEGHIECLRTCLHNLPSENRELIVEYYQGDKGTKIENRKKLSERFKVPVNTLRMRALRLREKLQTCMEDCLKGAPDCDESAIAATYL